MEYKSKNNGLLRVEDVKEGDKIVLMEPAYEQFSEAKQKSYWNCKVKLPNGTEKLAGLMDSSCEAFAAKWGGNTDNWAGQTVTVALKTSKAGNTYITLVPTDESKIEAGIPVIQREEDINDINPADIPF